MEQYYHKNLVEAGCDEAGRGCLAGPVIAAAVIFPKDIIIPTLKDSKKLTALRRQKLIPIIKENAIAYAIGIVDHKKIDEINILNASFLAMHKAIKQLAVSPEFLLIDGNRFLHYQKTPHQCIIKGDDKYLSIAAASVLAKETRDDFMKKIDTEFPGYDWAKNKGYPTKVHRAAIQRLGSTPYHRKTFNLLGSKQQTLF